MATKNKKSNLKETPSAVEEVKPKAAAKRPKTWAQRRKEELAEEASAQLVSGDAQNSAEAAPKEPTFEEQVLEVLRNNLNIRVETGGFTSPNDRHIKVMLGKEVICETYFDVRTQREYEG